VLFIKLPLLLRGLPESHEVVVLALLVFVYLEDERVQTVSDPANGAILFGTIRALVEIVRMGKQYLRFLEANASFRIGS
jgi:hypothetical protein